MIPVLEQRYLKRSVVELPRKQVVNRLGDVNMMFFTDEACLSTEIDYLQLHAHENR